MTVAETHTQKCSNLSLSALQNCFRSISTQNSHIPYRDSKLTYALREVLNLDSEMSIIICIANGNVRNQSLTNHVGMALQFGIWCRVGWIQNEQTSSSPKSYRREQVKVSQRDPSIGRERRTKAVASAKEISAERETRSEKQKKTNQTKLSKKNSARYEFENQEKVNALALENQV
jgi:hypothetical protein